MVKVGETMEIVRYFIFGGSKITVAGDCSYEIKICLLLGRKAMTNLDSILKSRDITLPKNGPCSQSCGFSSSPDGCEIWTIKKAGEWLFLNCGVGEDSLRVPG